MQPGSVESAPLNAWLHISICRVYNFSKNEFQVNLLPCDRPNDVYSSVALRYFYEEFRIFMQNISSVEQKRAEDEHSEDETLRSLACALRAAMPQVFSPI